MDIYVLDEDFMRAEVIDAYESFIWTERYQSYGDFELVFPSSQQIRTLLPADSWIAINESHRIMRVETLEPMVDDEGRSLIKFKGRSLESVLLHRAARGFFSNPPALPPADYMQMVFEMVCMDGVLSQSDIFPNLGPYDPIGVGNNPLPTAGVRLKDEDITTVYDTLVKVATAYDIGFRLVLDRESGTWNFKVDPGSNRTATQSTLRPVIFSHSMDTLSNSSELYSVENHKNVALVYSGTTRGFVYADNMDESTAAGLDRRVLFVDAGDPPEGMAVSDHIQQKGREALAEHRRLQAMDGEVPKNSSYAYGVDYQLGDLVEMRNADGVVNVMRVMEQIFVSDSEGVRSYPTLVTNQFITPGSWLDWKYNTFWIDAQGEWATQ